jgi:pimeloyl-ACP methyl ester carboxylesterase
MKYVTSKDGTRISYEEVGDGPAVLLVGGGLDDGSENAPLAPALATQFTVYNYARRGRAGSGDTQPYALDREIEDIANLLEVTGGSAHAFGASSGGALVLEGVAAGLPIDTAAVYEVPYCLARDMADRARAYVAQLGPLLAEGRRGDALELFMWFAGSSAADIAQARESEWWPGLEAIAHTLAYDAACMGDFRPPTERLARIERPVLVLTGGCSPGSQGGMGGLPPDFFDQAADAIAAALPRSERLTLEGAGHMVDAKALAPVLGRFFGCRQR